MAFVDQALKLDARALMAAAMRTGRKSRYLVTISAPAGQQICRDLRDRPDRVATASITVNWPAKGDETAIGGVWLNYSGWDDRPAEQTLSLTGIPAKIGGWRWRLTCPETRQQVQTLYLPPDADRFQSLQASELKYRRARGKADRHLRRCFKLMHQLKTDHFGPGIGKPPGMSSRRFDKLERQLTNEHIRYYCALLGKREPDFNDEEPQARMPATPAVPPLRRLGGRPKYFRDQSGSIRMRAKFNKQNKRPIMPRA